MPRTDAEELASLCVAAQQRLSRAGHALHDEAGGLLAAAGLRLQLLELDYPAAATGLREVSAILEQAMHSVRSVSRELSPSPVFGAGLHRALEKLDATVDYKSTAALPPETLEAVYSAAAAAIEAANNCGAECIKVRVRGDKGLTVRIEDDGARKGRARALGPAGHLARASGLALAITTGKRTIVLIRVIRISSNALRRPPGRRP